METDVGERTLSKLFTHGTDHDRDRVDPIDNLDRTDRLGLIDPLDPIDNLFPAFALRTSHSSRSRSYR